MSFRRSRMTLDIRSMGSQPRHSPCVAVEQATGSRMYGAGPPCQGFDHRTHVRFLTRFSRRIRRLGGRFSNSLLLWPRRSLGFDPTLIRCAESFYVAIVATMLDGVSISGSVRWPELRTCFGSVTRPLRSEMGVEGVLTNPDDWEILKQHCCIKRNN